MKIYRSLAEVEHNPNSVVTVGTFDGVHLGHAYVLSQLFSIAEAQKGEPTIVTFHPHPHTVLGGANKKSLTVIDEKLRRLSEYGNARIIAIPFTSTFSRLEAKTFVGNILCNIIGMKAIVMGFDHGFGKNRAGSIQTVKALALENNINVFELEQRTIEDRKVSSSRIRQLLRSGQIEEANTLLGYSYSCTGVVVRGAGRGKKLGFPTANVQIADDDKLVPGCGVYIVRARIGTKVYNAVANIGFQPTFNGRIEVLEVHIIGFESAIYNESLEISFYKKIRDEKKFDTPSELICQVKCDKETAKKYFIDRTKYV